MVMNTEEIANRLIERNGISMQENKEYLKELVYEHPKEALRELCNNRIFYTYSMMNDNYNRLKAKEGNAEKLLKLEKVITEQEKFDIIFDAIVDTDRCGEIYGEDDREVPEWVMDYYYEG
jgi:hypothetical protein